MATPSIDQSSMSSLVPLVSLDHQAHSKQTASGKGTDALRKRSLLPRRLRAVWPDTLLVLAADLGSAVLSLLFFAFGIAVYFYDGTDANEQFAGGRNISETLFNVSRIGATIFTYVFAAVVGRAVKALLLWRLDRGERLGTLDSLAGSGTLVGTLMTWLELRTFSIVAVALVVVWSVSPLGSQSVLRVIATGESSTSADRPYEYMDVNSSLPWFGTSERAGPIKTVPTLFTASLISSWQSKCLRTDSWGNVKIPFLERLDANNAGADGWHAVDHGVADEAAYASLIGIPIANISDPAFDKEFTMETSYWWLNCPTISNAREPVGINVSAYPWYTTSGSTGFSLSTKFRRLSMTDAKLEARPLVVNTRIEDMLLGVFCHIQTTYVEARVQCTRADCGISAVRRSLRPHPSLNWTTLDSQSAPIWENIIYIFLSTAAAHPLFPTMFHYYLADPSAPVLTSPGDYSFSGVIEQLGHVTNTDFAFRFGQMLNTFWVAAAGYLTVSSGSAGLSAASTPWTQGDWLAYGAEYPYLNATGTQTRRYPSIRCQYGWLACLLAASLLLFITSFVPTAVRLAKQTPDLSLNISSMIRDNPYVDTPVGGAASSTLDARQQARMWKNVKVRFGDVVPENEVGHLAIGVLGHGKLVAKAKKDRLYD